MHYKSLLGSLLVVTALLAASCGDSDPERDQALVAAFADDLLSEDDPITTNTGEATCIGEKTYDVFGTERLAELGITVDAPDPSDADITEAEAEGIVDGLYECTDVEASFMKSITNDNVTAEDAQCFVDALGDDMLRDALKQGLLDSEGPPSQEFIDQFTAASTECSVLLG